MSSGDRLLQAARFRWAAGSAAATWTAAQIMHANHIAAVYPALVTTTAAAATGWAVSSRGAREHTDGQPRAAARRHGRQAAAAMAAGGGWLTAATAAGPLTGPDHAMTVLLGLGTLAGYACLNGHDLVRKAREWRRRRMKWLETAYRYGLDGSHLRHWERTRLGWMARVDTKGTGRRASQLAGPGSHVAELIAETLSLPPSRVQVTRAHHAGEIVIKVRETDPWAEPIPHPLLGSDPEIRLPVPATIRQPAVVGQDPDTGTPLRLTLWDSHGGKNIAVVGKRDAGKSTLLNCIRERVTACEDALLADINVSKAIEDLEWSPACYESAIGDGQQHKAIEILDWLCGIVAARPKLGRTTATHQPAREHPAIVCVIDEIGVLMRIPGAADRLKYLASQGRSEGLTIVFAGQRAIANWIGGTDVRTQVDIVCIGRVGEQSEARKAAGDLEIPNLSAYGEGAAGVWLIGWREAGGAYQMGRAFNFSDILDVREIAYERRNRPVKLEAALPARPSVPGNDDRKSSVSVAAGDPPPPPQESDLGVYDREHGHLEDALSADDRQRLAALDVQRAENTHMLRENETALEQFRNIPDEDLKARRDAQWAQEIRNEIIPPASRQQIMKLLEGDGTTIAKVAETLSVKAYTARKWLERLRAEGVARVVGEKRGARWQLASTQGRDPS
jgi:hypothetical protein